MYPFRRTVWPLSRRTSLGIGNAAFGSYLKLPSCLMVRRRTSPSAGGGCVWRESTFFEFAATEDAGRNVSTRKGAQFGASIVVSKRPTTIVPLRRMDFVIDISSFLQMS